MKKITILIALLLWRENNEKFTFIFVAKHHLSGCIFTKVVSTPLRVTGSVISIVPVVGSGVQTILSSTADSIDIIGIVLD